MLRRLLKGLFVATSVLVLLVAGLTAWLWFQLHASLAQLEGNRSLPGLTQAVSVERDALGVPTLRGTNRLDVTRALGFVHAQERFFQMDLLRRSAAGELAELFGAAAVDRDFWARRHRFRHRAQDFVAQRATPSERAALEAYTDGVNAGLKALGAVPPEYLLLRTDPQPWRTEDCVLSGFAMFFALQDSEGKEDHLRALMGRLLPKAVADFYLTRSSSYPAAVDDTVLPPPVLPSPQTFSFRTETNRLAQGEVTDPVSSDAFVPGSNNWAVDGSVSATGAAIVANDMHLDLRLPHYWFRARLVYDDPEVGAQELIGVTLPGTPVMIVGSNRHIAWAFTNAFLDNTDLVRLEVDPANPNRYRVPDGWQDFERLSETIRIKGGSPREQVITNTLWGPVVSTPGLPGLHALSWIAHRPGAVNMGLLELERARDVASAVRLAPQIGVPLQNLVVGDRVGAIAYTPIGRLPSRVGFSGEAPASWADGTCRWDGFLPAEKYPRLMSPVGGRLWTANHRVMGSPEYLACNPVDQDFGARAQQIRDGLRRMQRVKETDLLELYRDDRGFYLERWQAQMLTVLAAGAATNAAWRELKGLVEAWGGRAVPASAGYRLVRDFRGAVVELVLQPVWKRLRDAGAGPGLWPHWTWETPVWEIVHQRAEHLIGPEFASLDDLLRRAVDRVLERLAQERLAPAEATWGKQNEFAMRHPISQAVPRLSRWLDIPPAQLPGDDFMPRAQGRGWGASERMVVSPGREEQGIYQMPGGQSGHFLSPFYRAGHAAWMNVEPSPLLPGPALHQLTLRP